MSKNKLKPGVLNQLKSSGKINYDKLTKEDVIQFLDNYKIQDIAGKLIMENYGHSFKTGIINE